MNMKCNEIQIWSSNSDLDDKRLKSNQQKGKYFTVQTVHERKKKTKKSSQIGKISKGTAAATVTKQERKRKLSSFQKAISTEKKERAAASTVRANE